MRVQHAQDIEKTRRMIEQVLKVPSSISSEAGEITAPMANADLVTDLLIALRGSYNFV